MGSTITLPHLYSPRLYQVPFLKAMDQGYRRASLVWHRRCGKDKTIFNFTLKEAFKRVGTYYYFFPTYTQGKKILWNGVDRDGMRFLDHVPKEALVRRNNTEMLLELVNGSIVQIIGTDNYDSIRGTNPVGCVFSEYSYQDPGAWDVVRPILLENGGWAVFNFTPQGKNHAHKLHQMAERNDAWFSQVLTVDDTTRPDGSPVIRPEDVQAERDEGVEEDIILQEYYCSFDAAIRGAYYAEQLRRAEVEGRIGKVPYDPRLSVDTWWDLGVGDATAIWFTQFLNNEVRFIDYYENSGEGLSHYFKMLKAKPYKYGTHWGPHDIEVRELGTGMSRLEYARKEGVAFRVVPKLDVDDGIDAARRVFKQCHFDKVNCERGLNALSSYRKEWDEKRQEYKRTPYHNWSSHGSDAFRYFSVGFNKFVSRGSISIGGAAATAEQPYGGAI